MDAMKRRVVCLLAFAGVIGLLAVPASAWAQQAVSPAYSVDEVFFGTGGELEACSADGNSDGVSYCSKQSAGETAVGNSVSPTYQTQAGFNTNREEYLEFIVNSSNTSLGNLTTSSPATLTGTFSVKAYLASGYSVINASDPPSGGGTTPHTLTNLTSPTAYNSTAEQFGINLVANTSPTTFGAAASQQPDSSFGFGAAATGYDTANQYKYVKGDTIASSTKSSGQTNFTVSYLVKINGQTPAGKYTFNHVMVALGTY